MRQIFLITAGAMLAVSVIVGAFTLTQANQEEITLTSRLQSRTQVLAESLAESVEPSVAVQATSSIQRVIDRFADNQRLAGLQVFDSTGAPLVSSENLPASADQQFVSTVMDSDEANGTMVRNATSTYYVFTTPLRADDRVIGALTLIQNASYIDQSIRNIWQTSLLRLLLQLMFFAAAIYALVRWGFFKPIADFTASLQAIRRGETVPEHTTAQGIIQPLISEIGKMTTSLHKARSVASEEARMRLEKLDTPWTAERLKEFVKASLKNRPIYVVSNREPYIHHMGKKGIEVRVPASGMVTALESVMDACGGTWIAHGSGNADKQSSDADGKIRVPIDEPRYTLKRVWLTKEDVQGFYTGFSNEALWPLCLMAHNRPLFREEDWLAYRKVNGKFAKVVLNEIKDVQQPIILVQDYHFALLPAMIKKSRPDAQIGLFWHIPWPSAEQFSICPRRKELIAGILGADVVGFHTQQYCNNFMETVAKEVESIVDFEQFSVTKGGHISFVKPFPVSVAFTSGAETPKTHDAEAMLSTLGIRTKYLAIGVDRLDYTKGILERLKAVEFLLDERPEFREHFTFLQIAAPSRESVPKYREYAEQVAAEVERINKKFGTSGWRPVVFEHRHYSHEELLPLYRAADVCVVSSLHDGMNLVAKEYVAARDDEQGALVLSQFTGAARALTGALVVNPYSAEQTAAALHEACTMSSVEQHRRMKSMRASVRDYNIYRWAAEFLKAVATLG